MVELEISLLSVCSFLSVAADVGSDACEQDEFMDSCFESCTDGWIEDGCRDGWIDGCRDGWIDGCKDSWVEGCWDDKRDGCMDGWI